MFSTITHRKLIAVAALLAGTFVRGETADLDFCLRVPAPGSFELSIVSRSADHAGLAGFSATLLGNVTSFTFEPLLVTLSESPLVTTGFDVLGSGYAGTAYNIYGAQTLRAPNIPLYDLSTMTVTVTGVDGEVQFAAMLPIGAGTYSGPLPPVLVSAAAAGNVFALAANGTTFAAIVSESCWLAGDLNCDGEVNFGDINPFVLYLSNFAAWQAAYPDCPPESGDINGDGLYPSFADINPFVALLTNP